MPKLRSTIDQEIEADFHEFQQITEGLARLEQQQAELARKRAIILNRIHGNGVVLRKIAAVVGTSPQTIANWKQQPTAEKGSDAVPVQRPVTRRALPPSLSNVRGRDRTS